MDTSADGVTPPEPSDTVAYAKHWKKLEDRKTLGRRSSKQLPPLTHVVCGNSLRRVRRII